MREPKRSLTAAYPKNRQSDCWQRFVIDRLTENANMPNPTKDDHRLSSMAPSRPGIGRALP